VSLDGRYDMYGRKIITEVQDMFADRPGTAAEMQRDRITCVLGPSAMPLVKRLSSAAGWAVRGHDKVRTLLVRAAGAVA
jgi:hypothetical protein